VLAYIAQSLLNGLAARRRELRDEQSLAEEEPEIIWDMPRPRYEDEPSPDLAPAHHRSSSDGPGLPPGTEARVTRRQPRVTDHEPLNTLLDPLPGAAYP
jgi:hypothetical protein